MQVFNFVGFHFNLHLGKNFITQKNCAKVLSVAEHMGYLDQAPTRKSQSLIVTFQAQATLIPLGRLKVRSIQFHLSRFWNQNQDPLDQLVPSSQAVKAILQWWQQNLEILEQGIPLELPTFTHDLFTDAPRRSGEHTSRTPCARELGITQKPNSI